MDASTFDHLARTLFTHGSRRTALGVLLAGAGTALGLVGQRATAQGCRANGERCHADAACCSGRCKRRNNGKKVCKQAESQGICTVHDDRCTGPGFTCGTHSDGSPCQCYVTTRGRAFCGAFPVIQPDDCDCASNRECEERLGPGAKCLAVGVSTESPCDPCEAAGSGCMPPCTNPFPPA